MIYRVSMPVSPKDMVTAIAVPEVPPRLGSICYTPPSGTKRMNCETVQYAHSRNRRHWHSRRMSLRS